METKRKKLPYVWGALASVAFAILSVMAAAVSKPYLQEFFISLGTVLIVYQVLSIFVRLISWAIARSDKAQEFKTRVAKWGAKNAAKANLSAGAMKTLKEVEKDPVTIADMQLVIAILIIVAIAVFTVIGGQSAINLWETTVFEAPLLYALLAAVVISTIISIFAET